MIVTPRGLIHSPYLNSSLPLFFPKESYYQIIFCCFFMFTSFFIVDIIIDVPHFPLLYPPPPSPHPALPLAISTLFKCWVYLISTKR